MLTELVTYTMPILLPQPCNVVNWIMDLQLLTDNAMIWVIHLGKRTQKQLQGQVCDLNRKTTTNLVIGNGDGWIYQGWTYIVLFIYLLRSLRFYLKESMSSHEKNNGGKPEFSEFPNLPDFDWATLFNRDSFNNLKMLFTGWQVGWKVYPSKTKRMNHEAPPRVS
jgi:hypothetical protein